MSRKSIISDEDGELTVGTSQGRIVLPGPKRAAGPGGASEDLGEEGWAEVREDRLRGDVAAKP